MLRFLRWLFVGSEPSVASCRHEWVFGNPKVFHSRPDEHPAVCRWCNARRTFNETEAHHVKEWQRLEKLKTEWPQS
jgi:hypothetical protein